MTKKEVQQRVSQNGKPLELNKFEWDEKAKAFSTVEDNLVLDFNGIDFCTFKTGPDCTFKTGYGCTFDTGSNCTFDTGSNCTFKTGYGCTFYTSSGCTFDTSSDCTLDTSSNCTFKTGYGCIFKTGYGCTFDAGYGCVVVRHDIYEVIELEEGVKIKLNNWGQKGFTKIDEDEEVTIKISKKSLEALKDSGIKIIEG